MRVLFALAIALTFLRPVAATHGQGCVPTEADPATYNVLTTPDGRAFYIEERNTGLPPVPGSGFLLGDGTWIYEETNGVAGLQRGGIGLLGAGFPRGCDPNPKWNPWDLTYPCVLTSEDPINDENCGHGPDLIITGLAFA